MFLPMSRRHFLVIRRVLVNLCIDVRYYSNAFHGGPRSTRDHYLVLGL